MNVQALAAYVVVGIAIVLAFGLGALAGSTRNSEPCFDGYVAISQYYPDGVPNPFSKVIVGDATFCGYFSDTVGPTELYHAPHGTPQ